MLRVVKNFAKSPVVQLGHYTKAWGVCKVLLHGYHATVRLNIAYVSVKISGLAVVQGH